MVLRWKNRPKIIKPPYIWSSICTVKRYLFLVKKPDYFIQNDWHCLHDVLF